MALDPSVQYPAQTDTTDPTGYPYGAAKNVGTPGDGSGTPWEKALVNDIFGMQQALLTAAGIVPSGTPDKVGASDYLTAIQRIGSKAIARNAARTWPSSSAAISLPSTGGAPTVESIAGNKEWWLAVGKVDGVPDPLLAYATHASTTWGFNTSLGTSVNLFGSSWDTTNGLFIVCGGAGNPGYIGTGADPSGTITSRTSNATATLRVVHANTAGVSVAAGEHDGTDMAASRSTDATSWAAIAMAGSATDTVIDIASSGTTFVAVGYTSAGVPLIWISTDSGATFSVVTIPGGFTDKPVSITHDGVRFIVLGDDGAMITSQIGATATWAVKTGPTITAGTGASVKADPVSGMILVLAGSALHLSEDTAASWSRVPHIPAHTGAVPAWDMLGFDGSAWAAVDVSNANDTLAGCQSLSVPVV